ncbi:MAG: DEAD/DEAH box helicase [Candidatus Lokiarchaeota archaeon]|nr:DEAD/DEAH box helicase [Candidatus Lokiarchaeota archaeon]
MCAKVNKEDYLNHPLVKQNIVVRREYQENIFVNCLNKDALVVIPTGLGKTIIALMLAVQRLTEKPGSKVVFLAPTKPLVEQHYKSFLDLTEIAPDSLKAITGSISPDKRKQLWEKVIIAFMTPQVFQNDIVSALYSTRDVSLIIFDEAHRAVGDYAYCFIAKKYIESSRSPQILGLTASPGSTEEKISEIKRNLFIEHLEIRTEKDNDVNPYVHDVEQLWIRIKLPYEFLEIKNILDEKLKSCYKFLKENDLLSSHDINKVTRKDILKLDKVISKRISSTKDDSERFQMFHAKKISANAIRISHMAELIETQGINALKEYIDKNEEKIEKNTANKSLKELFRDKDFKCVRELTYLSQSKGLIHPKITKLIEILEEQIQKDQNSRILVFCHFRDSVNNIVRVLKKSNSIRVHKFVGQANKSSDKGLTQKQQVQLLDEFKKGEYNVLIGTSVAEEGLDIAECDLVVFYDVVPSAIRSIQRRGRTGRKRDGKVCVLMAENTRDEGYYWAERTKEKNMKESLNKMKKYENEKSTGQSNLLNFISNESKKIDSSNKIDGNYYESISPIEDAKKIEITCDYRETSSSVVRILSLMGVNVKLEQLNVADYIISNRTGIERKSSKDFSDSIKDGRLFEELSNLKKNFERAILILEGDPFTNSSVNINALYGAISSIILNLGIVLYKTEDPKETALFLYHMAKKEQGESKGSLKLRFEKAPLSTSRLLEYIIAGIPGVNSQRATSLLKKMCTLQNIFNSDIPDLTKVENIGRKIAQEIYKLSRFKYLDDSQN